MEGLQKELNELRKLFQNITPETETEYKQRFLAIQERYTGPETADAINDFMLWTYKYMNDELAKLEKRITSLENSTKKPSKE